MKTKTHIKPERRFLSVLLPQPKPVKQRARFLFLVYAAVACLDLLFILWQRHDLRWFSKTLLMPVLMAAFYSGAADRGGTPFFLVLAALFLSWCGDGLLQAANLFIPGLASFLLAHLAYILYFRRIGKRGRGFIQGKPLLVLAVLLYLALFLVLLFPYLGRLKIPVVLYSLTIGAMLLMAINSRRQAGGTESLCYLWGAVLFVVSDSLLAISLFVVKNPAVGLLVMATYATAQSLIVKGALLHRDSSTHG